MSWECKECGWTNKRDFGDCMYCRCVRNDSSNVATMNCGLPSVDLIQSNYTHQESLIQNICSSTQNFLIPETTENDGKCDLDPTDQVNSLQEPDCADENDKKVSSINNQMVTRENFEFVSFENVTLEANCGTLAPQIKEEPLDWNESFEAPEGKSVSQEFEDFKQEISDNLDEIGSATQPLAESIDSPQPSENMCEPSNCYESEYNFETHNIKTESVNCDALLNIEEQSDHNYVMKLETETEVNEVVDRRADENVDGQVSSAASISLPYCEANALVLKYYFEHCGEAESTDTISQSEYGFESAKKSPVDISNDSKASSRYIKKTLNRFNTRMKKMKNLLRGSDGYFYCENCDRDIPIPEFYKSHIELFEEKRHCKCALCGKIVSNMTFVTFLKHMYIHLLLYYPKSTRCTSCKTSSFFSKYNLNLHELRWHPSNNSALPSNVSLNMSVETEYMTTLQACEVNAPRFASLFTELKKLVHNLVSGTTKLQHVIHCSSCSLDFPATTYLNSHFAQCLKEGLFHCPFCPTHHRPQPDLTEFVCQMLQHVRRLTVNFECKECDKLFLNAINHQLHSQIAHCHRVLGDKTLHVYIRPFAIRKRLLNHSDGSGDPYDIAEKKVSRQKRRLNHTDLLPEKRVSKLSSKFIGTSYKEFHTGKVLKQETEMIKSAELLGEESKN